MTFAIDLEALGVKNQSIIEEIRESLRNFRQSRRRNVKEGPELTPQDPRRIWQHELVYVNVSLLLAWPLDFIFFLIKKKIFN